LPPSAAACGLLGTGSLAFLQSKQATDYSGAHYQIDNNRIDIYVPAIYQQTELGYVLIRLKIHSLIDVLWKDLPIILFIAFFMLFLSFLLANFLEKQFTDPILKLVRFLEEIIDDGKLDKRVATNENNEFKILYREVNTMLESLEASQQQLKLASVSFDTPSGMLITDANHTIIQANKAFYTITGYTPEETIGNTTKMLQSGRHSADFYRAMWRDIKEKNYWSGEIWNRHKDGHFFPEYLTIQPVFNAQNSIQYYVGSFIDLTMQKRAEEKLDRLSMYDPITNLANRAFLMQSIGELLEQRYEMIGLICFDINNFKMINDTFGHDVGDLVLMEIAERLRADYAKIELICRLGGDEFSLLVKSDKTDFLQATLELEQLAEAVIDLIRRPFLIKQQQILCAGSAGIAYSLKNNPIAAIALIQQAEAALHQTKKLDNKFISFFDDKSEKVARSYFELYVDLSHAIEDEQLRLYYQPQVNEAGKVVGCEALIRWQHPEKGMISPADFIPVAEQSDLIIRIGQWVLETACKKLSDWQSVHPQLTVAINVSSKQFYQPDFYQQVKKLIEENNINASLIKLELTESLFAKDIDGIVTNMLKLSSLGVQISLDDFGTGYSSLQYLQKLPLHQVKIDQSFVKNMLNDNNTDESIIKAIISLGSAYGFNVIAEGVEQQSQLGRLVALGCCYFQGYYFSKPLALDAFEAFLLSDGNVRQ